MVYSVERGLTSMVVADAVMPSKPKLTTNRSDSSYLNLPRQRRASSIVPGTWDGLRHTARVVPEVGT
jgi:hypothetical protein